MKKLDDLQVCARCKHMLSMTVDLSPSGPRYEVGCQPCGFSVSVAGEREGGLGNEFLARLEARRLSLFGVE